MKDNGGWSSKGMPTRCKKCGNDDARMLETIIYGRTSRVVYCAVCSHDWIPQERDDDEGDNSR